MNLLEPGQLARIESQLTLVLGRIAEDASVPALAQTLIRFVQAGGKRVRPQLCYWTYLQGNHANPNRLDHAVLDLACAWELFHAFLLVHDDIIDGADMRREQVSLHRQLAALDSNCPVFGQNLGIVAGDLLFCAAMRVFHEVDLPDQLYRRQLKLFSRVACMTGFGQAVDICQSHVPLDQVCEKTLLRGYHWKTAAYTFEGPMVSGGICAGLDEGALAALSRFGMSIGQAYQLQNDLIDLSQPAHEGSDVLQGKRTITLVRGRASMTESQREEFDRRLAAIPMANGQAVALAESLRQQLLQTDAPTQTRALIGRLLDEARAATVDPALPARLARGLEALLARLGQQYFVLA